MRPGPLSEPRQNNGGSILLVLFLVFLIQKWAGAIDWSWWWVTAPIWIPVGLAFVIAIVKGTL